RPLTREPRSSTTAVVCDSFRKWDGFRLPTGSRAYPSCGSCTHGCRTDPQTAAVIAGAPLRPLHGFAERLQQDMRSTQRRLGVYDHLFQLGLVSLAALLVGGHEPFHGRGQQSGSWLVSGSATFAHQAILFQRRQHHANLAGGKGRYGGPDLVDAPCAATARGTETFDQSDELVVRRIPPGHEESL